MAQPWEAEQAVPPGLAAELIRAACPELGPVRVEEFGAGWDNSAYLINGGWVFRFPRRAVAVELLRNERRILPALAPTLPFRVPVPEKWAEPGASFTWPFSGYRLVRGRTAPTARLDDNARAALAVPLGEFLRALHAFPVERALELGVPRDTWDRMDLGKRVPRTRERLAEAHDKGLLLEPERLEWIFAEVPADWSPACDCLAHGDLYSLHLLVGDGCELTGVIDWGDVHLGDRAVDLAVAHSFLPVASHASFRAAYGDCDEATWAAARVRALLTAVTTLVYGADIGACDLELESRRALEFLQR